MTDTTIPLKAPPHLFEASVNIAMSGVTDRASQTERTCKTCGLTKITVHGNAGQSWREWRMKDGEAFIGIMPDCVAGVEHEQK